MFSSNFYLAWRAKRFASTAFAEKADQAPPEALLQQVWLYQRILQDRLQTIDGRAVRVLHPGFLNREAGPDFRRAIVQIGNEGPVTGDIEIDLISAGWEQHSHARILVPECNFACHLGARDASSQLALHVSEARP